MPTSARSTAGALRSKTQGAESRPPASAGGLLHSDGADGIRPCRDAVHERTSLHLGATSPMTHRLRFFIVAAALALSGPALAGKPLFRGESAPASRAASKAVADLAGKPDTFAVKV